MGEPTYARSGRGQPADPSSRKCVGRASCDVERGFKYKLKEEAAKQTLPPRCVEDNKSINKALKGHPTEKKQRACEVRANVDKGKKKRKAAGHEELKRVCKAHKAPKAASATENEYGRNTHPSALRKVERKKKTKEVDMLDKKRFRAKAWKAQALAAGAELQEPVIPGQAEISSQSEQQKDRI
ncbi:hypothetical protein NDU88_001770 [Pleurodeles waltl]|uniref:Uncharacterized protein n=1 Tax=Pleurodeles waltl TaxID=8319 RepID=A0AAV7Q5A7_PLEWA|nr:hypothetical protein NDU88_001770 [Pleurodeles waltl]